MSKSISKLSGTLERMRQSTLSLLYVRIDSGDGFFEHLWWIVTS
jgi:hypothetical protein